MGTQNAVAQVLNPLYGYYSTVGVIAAGYPTNDTQACPGIAGCQYQLFSLNYALFYYTVGGGYSVSGNIYTKWIAGNMALGMASAAPVAVTAASKVTATTQQFTAGLIATITSGVNSGSTFAVAEPAYDLYNSFGAAAGLLGLPTSDDVALAGGLHRQTFEGGRIEYRPGSAATVLLALAQLNIVPVNPVTLAYGQTIAATVRTFDTLGQEAFGRAVSWTTSNSGVVSVAAAGYSAVLTATGAGTATITAIGEGLVSKPLVITVTSHCCQVGEGAPTAAITQAFQAAVARNKLTVLVPAAAAVTRVSSGYAQDLYSSGGAIHYLVAESDSSSTAYVVTGPILTAYAQLGGLTGTLGFPTADVSAAGIQFFQAGALAGSSVQLVSGLILKKWAALNYSGLPTGPQTGIGQAFNTGFIYSTGAGYLVSGPILTRYLALSGPAGVLGVPISDQIGNLQNFQNGYIDVQPGAAIGVEHLLPQTPAVSTSPASALAGSRIHIAITGFTAGANLKVSQTGQADFTVTTPTGSYDWYLYIAPGTATGNVTIKAVDTGSSATATGSYAIRSLADVKPKITKSAGDNQTGSPGAPLSTPLTVTVTDSSGTPISGTAVSFNPSPGASVSPTSTVTDANGNATTAMRLPPNAGVSAVTAQSLGQIAIFNAQATGSTSLVNFPQFTGGPVAAAAAVLRYYQNRNQMPSVNGLADPATLDVSLKTLPDGYLNNGQIVNFWRLTNFTGGNVAVSIESTDLSAIRTLVAAGDPVLLNLATATIIATGVGADGSITVSDPNPTTSHPTFAEYGVPVLSALRLLPQAPATTGFLLYSNTPPASSGCSGPAALQALSFLYCDGTQSIYQINVGSTGPFQATITDLAAGGASQDLSGTAAAIYQVSRTAGRLTVAKPSVTFTADSILNAASFLPGISPGALISIFGTGFSPAATVSIGGMPATVLLSTPFQINAQVPPTLPAGSSTIQISSTFGSQSQPVSILGASPGIFAIGTASDGSSALGAILNQNNSVNGPTAPAVRGSTISIYCTGLGAAAVTAQLGGGAPLKVAFAGAAPGFTGLYQVNLLIPTSMPPGLLSLQLLANGVSSNSVGVTVQ